MASHELVLGTNGVNPDKKASVNEVFQMTERGRYAQLRVLNTTGRLTVRSLAVEAQVDERIGSGTIPYRGN